jgi:hypothetical protein
MYNINIIYKLKVIIYILYYIIYLFNLILLEPYSYTGLQLNSWYRGNCSELYKPDTLLGNFIRLEPANPS